MLDISCSRLGAHTSRIRDMSGQGRTDGVKQREQEDAKCADSKGVGVSERLELGIRGVCAVFGRSFGRFSNSSLSRGWRRPSRTRWTHP